MGGIYTDIPPSLVSGVAQWLDLRTFPDLRYDVQLTADLVVNRPLYVANMANSAIHPLWVDK